MGRRRDHRAALPSAFLPVSDSPAATPAAEEGQGAGPPWSVCVLGAGGVLVAETLGLKGLCERREIRTAGRARTLPELRKVAVLSPRSSRDKAWPEVQGFLMRCCHKINPAGPRPRALGWPSVPNVLPMLPPSHDMVAGWPSSIPGP